MPDAEAILTAAISAERTAQELLRALRIAAAEQLRNLADWVDPDDPEDHPGL